MLNKQLKLSALLLLGLILIGVQAQEAITTTGGKALGSGGSVSYSYGQIVYTTNTSASGSVTQGVQQPYEISVVTQIEGTTGIDLAVSAYPNPTTDYLQLKIESEKLKDLSFQLYDMNGKLVQNDKITGSKTTINMSNFMRATYFLHIIQSNKGVKTFKIIKN